MKPQTAQYLLSTGPIDTLNGFLEWLLIEQCPIEHSNLASGLFLN